MATVPDKWNLIRLLQQLQQTRSKTGNLILNETLASGGYMAAYRRNTMK